MSPISSISLSGWQPSDAGKITQLYRYLELFSEGAPPHHSLFIFAPASGPISLGDSPQRDEQLLIIDPPRDLATRFRLGNQSAALFTAQTEATDVPIVATQAGGVAHLRIGEHFLDVYSQQHSAVVHLPTLGIICGGNFGSDSTLPTLAPAADGREELGTLRLLARLIKQHRLALYIPRVGGELTEKTAVMERLAGDVAYLNELRRVVTPLALRGESVEAISDVAERALPQGRRSPLALATHAANVTALLQGMMR
jgi:hypothetical protein